MIKFSDNKDNREYLMIDRNQGLGKLLVSEIPPIFVYNEICEMYFNFHQIQSTSLEKETINDNVAFRKDSLLGSWLLENYDQEKIIYENQFVYHEKVVNAISIAGFSENPIYKEILPLFLNKVSGSKEELEKKYGEKVINYILKNDSLFPLSNEEKEPVEYIVFENGEYSKKKLSTGKVLEKK